MPTESLTRPWTICTLAAVAFGVSLTSPVPAGAQDMRVDRLEIVESGFFESSQATVTGAKQAEEIGRASCRERV